MGLVTDGETHVRRVSASGRAVRFIDAVVDALFPPDDAVYGFSASQISAVSFCRALSLGGGSIAGPPDDQGRRAEEIDQEKASAGEKPR